MARQLELSAAKAAPSHRRPKQARPVWETGGRIGGILARRIAGRCGPMGSFLPSFGGFIWGCVPVQPALETCTINAPVSAQNGVMLIVIVSHGGCCEQ